jgi:hypothetical protein
MNSRLGFRMTLAALLVLFGMSACFAQSCKVEVDSPKTGDIVGVRTQIVGIAEVPPGLYLWVFVRKEGQRKWWPQGGGNTEVNRKTGRWVSDAAFGEENDPAKDAGATFEITAVVVDSAAHNGLVSYVEQTEKTKQYPGTPLPPPAAKGGCALQGNVLVKRK